MLSVEDTPVVSVPVSVPVMSPDNWMREGGEESAAETEPAAPARPRFMSQDEDENPNTAKAFFFSSAAPAVATTVTVATPPARQPEAVQSAETPASAGQIGSPFDGIADPAPLSREYVPATRDAEPSTPQVTSLFGQSDAETERDLDVPAFLRRTQF
jgi:hypothetical protein